MMTTREWLVLAGKILATVHLARDYCPTVERLRCLSCGEGLWESEAAGLLCSNANPAAHCIRATCSTSQPPDRNR